MVGSENMEHDIFGLEKEHNINKWDLKGARAFAAHPEDEALSLSQAGEVSAAPLSTHASSHKLRK